MRSSRFASGSGARRVAVRLRRAGLRSSFRSGALRAGRPVSFGPGSFGPVSFGSATVAAVSAPLFFRPRPPRPPRRRLFFAGAGADESVAPVSVSRTPASGSAVGSGASPGAAFSAADSSAFLPKRNQRRGKVFLSFDRAREKRRGVRLFQRAAGVQDNGHGPSGRVAAGLRVSGCRWAEARAPSADGPPAPRERSPRPG